MAGRGTTRTGWITLVLFVCLVVFAQSASLSAQFESHHATDHCCLLCHVGAIPFLQVAVASRLTPVFREVWFAPPVDVVMAGESVPLIRASRAPPQSALCS